MKTNKGTFCAFLLFMGLALGAQSQLRPDAFPPVEESVPKASLEMASSLDQMRQWDRYPTYDVYVELMQAFVADHPEICRLDTIGTSVQGRLILALHITGTQTGDKPEFFYSSTMHGDELAGYYLMLRLCDTLLSAYGSDAGITQLLNTTEVFINPLSNPDGTYRGGNQTVAYSVRYNANNVDLNRNYPDPFGTPPLSPLQVENQAMINYVGQHHFRLAANLHGGSEVMNYPWDSFTSQERHHPDEAWWLELCQRFVDTCRQVTPRYMTSVNGAGVIEGGDWYVISNGRQDYMNQHFSIREMTMELSNTKKLPTNQLDAYWHTTSHALINFIAEVHHTPTSSLGVAEGPHSTKVYPNPTTGRVTIEQDETLRTIDLGDRPAGIYPLTIGGTTIKIIKL